MITLFLDVGMTDTLLASRVVQNERENSKSTVEPLQERSLMGIGCVL